jgi:hypothetical protein
MIFRASLGTIFLNARLKVSPDSSAPDNTEENRRGRLQTNRGHTMIDCWRVEQKPRPTNRRWWSETSLLTLFSSRD